MRELKNAAEMERKKQFMYEYAFLVGLEDLFWNRERDSCRKPTLFLYASENSKEARERAQGECEHWLETMLVDHVSESIFDLEVRIAVIYEEDAVRHRLEVDFGKVKIVFYVVPPARGRKLTVWHKVKVKKSR